MRHRAMTLAMLLSCGSLSGAQTPGAVPFGVGERLYFTVRSKVGTVGRAEMAITGWADVGGTNTLVASFTTRVRVAFMRGSTWGRSWIDPMRMTSLRYVEDEHRPFGSERDSIEIDPANRRWTGLSGDTGSTATDQPLDELSFIYFLRTIDLAPDSLYSFDRFYDKRRTPTTVRVVRRDTLRAPYGIVGAVVVEMNVKDKVGRGGDKSIRLWFSDDGCRTPVRIETSLPYLGRGVMVIDSVAAPGCVAPSKSSAP